MLLVCSFEENIGTALAVLQSQVDSSCFHNSSKTYDICISKFSILSFPLKEKIAIPRKGIISHKEEVLRMAQWHWERKGNQPNK